MKKNRMMRLASILLVCVLLSTSVISGTFAKYTSTASGSDSARVAKWDIKVENQKLGVNNSEITFGLFDTILDSDGNAETEVLKGDPSIIAPGTSGSFNLDLRNDSEVTAKYTIALKENNDYGVPIQYSLDNANWTNDFEVINTTLKDIVIDMQGDEADHTIFWRWAFEGTYDNAPAEQTDLTDTALGINALTVDQLVTITATVTVEQVD